MDVDEGVLKLKLDMVKRRNLFLIFKEAINNLAKYSKASTAHVEMSMDHGKLKLKIKDDGVGFNADQKSDRHGLANMKKRAQELGGSVSISSQKDLGTTVSIEIPLT
jgi:signal transduction histidine kinase